MSGASGIPRPLRIGVGGPVGSGKTALVETLCRRLRDQYDLAVITNDIYTQEDAQFLIRRGALPEERVLGVECLEEGHGLGPETVARLAVDVPLAIHGCDRLGLLKLVEEPAQALRPKGHAGAQVGSAESRRSRLAQVLFDHL